MSKQPRRCSQCRYFNTKAPGELHGQCHAPIPIWVIAEFCGQSGVVVGAVDEEWNAERCELFHAAATASSGGTPGSTRPGTA